MKLSSHVSSTRPDKESVLLIHGMGSASTAWKTIEPKLTDVVNVVTIDLPGHGKTPLDPLQLMDPLSLANSVIETMSDIGISTFHIVGNSLGGWIALELAAMQPTSVLSVTALAPAGLWLKPFEMRYPGTAIARMLASSLRVVSPKLLHYEWARKIGFENVSPLWRNFSYELCLDASDAMATAAGYFPAWDALLKKRFDKNISSNIPVTVIFGDADQTLPESTCQERSLVPSHAEWIVLKECGHAPMWDHPDEVVELIFSTMGLS